MHSVTGVIKTEVNSVMDRAMLDTRSPIPSKPMVVMISTSQRLEQGKPPLADVRPNPHMENTLQEDLGILPEKRQLALQGTTPQTGKVSGPSLEMPSHLLAGKVLIMAFHQQL